MDVDTIILRMDEGFGKLHKKLDAVILQTQERQLNCMARFSMIERAEAVRAALTGAEGKMKENRVRFNSWVAGSLMITLIIGVGIILWKIFLGHIDLVVKQ